MKENILKLGKLIDSSYKILLINHVRMDPDAFGSLMAFSLVLKKIGKEVRAINDENMPESFNFLYNENIFEPILDINSFNPNLIISFDAASLGQLGKTYENNKDIFNSKDFVVLDHHITNNGFGTLNIINTESSSTCELVFDILETLNLKENISKDIATLLYAGIITDTNIFYNVNTTKHTLEVASKLHGYGADFRAPIFEFFKKKSFNKTRLWGEALKDIEKNDNGKIVWVKIQKELLEKTNTSDRDINGIIDMLVNIDGVEIAFIIYPLPDGTNKSSFRSNNYNVGELCNFFGGGGHKQAAGFSSSKKQIDIEKMILQKIKEL